MIAKMDMKDISLDHLDNLKLVDMEEYMEYLKYRFNDKNQEVTNKERGIMRKISSLKSFYNCLLYTSRGSIGENFPAGTLAARLGEEVIAIALFEDRESGAAEEMIEEFVLQLFWKRSMNGKKEFVNPEYCMVSYPADGSHAAELLRHAAERFERDFKRKNRWCEKNIPQRKIHEKKD